MKPDNQLPFVLFRVFLILNRITNESTRAPDNSLIIVNPAASIAPSPRASLQSIELAAKAISANPVKIIVFIR
jgi:hypothetical protein